MIRVLSNAKKGLAATLADRGRVALGVFAALAAVVAAAWLANPKAVAFTLTSPSFADAERPWLVARLLGWSLTAFSWQVLALIALNAALFGLHVAITSHYMARRFRVGRASHAGTFGAVVAMFGFGCASCGSAFLALFVGGSATAAVFSHLPLGGLEFGIAGSLLMAGSAVWAASKVPSAETCAVPIRRRK